MFFTLRHAVGSGSTDQMCKTIDESLVHSDQDILQVGGLVVGSLESLLAESQWALLT